MEEQKKSGEGVEEIRINESKEEKSKQNGTSYECAEMYEVQNNKIKNLISVLIVLSGVVLGSLFVDVVQFLSQSGYSPKALKNAGVFVSGEKTWVAFDDPVVQTQVLSVSDEDLADCPDCDPAEVLSQLKKIIPTLIAKKVDASSDEGKAMIEKYRLRSIPAFVFDKEIKNTEFYSGAGASAIFEEKENNFVLNSSMVGISAGKYLEFPEIEEGDFVYGNKESDVKIIIFSDYQCPYSKMLHTSVKEVIEEFKDRVAFVYKDLPLDFHPQAKFASLSARCAQEQGKFWEMTNLLYDKQEEWGEKEGKEIFNSYIASVGLEANSFKECFNSDKYLEKISKDAEVASSFGISGTPSGFIGDKFIGGVLQKDSFKKAIEDQLAK